MRRTVQLLINTRSTASDSHAHELPLTPSLLRRRSPGSHNPYQVVGERGMHTRQFNLRHMASHAILQTHRTCRPRMILSRLSPLPARMATQTFNIVRSGFLHERFVRIVTGNASQSSVPAAPATAVF